MKQEFGTHFVTLDMLNEAENAKTCKTWYSGKFHFHICIPTVIHVRNLFLIFCFFVKLNCGAYFYLQFDISFCFNIFIEKIVLNI